MLIIYKRNEKHIDRMSLKLAQAVSEEMEMTLGAVLICLANGGS
jgi:hypothetical protein